MTKTEQLAERCADKKAMHEAEYYESYIAIKDAYRNGAQDMLERACEWIKTEVLEDYAGIIWENIVDDFRKAMEE